MQRDTKIAVGISFAMSVFGIICIFSGYFHGVDIGERRHKVYISECILEEQRKLNVTEGCGSKIALALWELAEKNWEKSK